MSSQELLQQAQSLHQQGKYTPYFENNPQDLIRSKQGFKLSVRDQKSLNYQHKTQHADEPCRCY